MTPSPVVSPRRLDALVVADDAGMVGVDKRAEPSGSKKRKKRKPPASLEDSDSFLATPVECAKLLHTFSLSLSSMPLSEDLVFSRSYIEWASFEAHVISLLFCCFFFALLILLCLFSIIKGQRKQFGWSI